MITEGRFVKTWLPVHLKLASPYVDRFVLVDDGTFPPDTKQYLSQFTNRDIVILTRKWDNCHVCQRNVYIDYLKKEGGVQWCLVMDSDEFPSRQLLEFYSKLGDDVTTGYATPSHDIRYNKPPPLEGGKNLNISSENTKTELPAGQLNGHEEREPISPAIPAGEERSSTHKRGVTAETSVNPRPSGQGGGQIRIGYRIPIDPVFTYYFGDNGYLEEKVSGGEEPPDEVKKLAEALGITEYAFFRQFDFKKLNIFPILDQVRYEGTVHEALVGVKSTPLNYPYYHIKALWEVHRDGFRNYVEGGSGVNLGDKNPHYVEMKQMFPSMNWHDVRKLEDLTPILLWFYMNAGDTGHEWSSETFDIYMYIQYATRSVLPFKYEKTWILENPVYFEIKDLYNAILHRDPDPSGLESYSKAFYEKTLDEIIESILKSDEFLSHFSNL